MGAWGPHGGQETSWVPGPKNTWGPRTSGSLETFGCPISPVSKTSPHFLSILKHYCHLIAIWALLHFPGCARETAGSQPYTTFWGPSGARNLAFPGPSEAHDLAFPGPLSTCMIRSSLAGGPINLLPLLPPVQGTALAYQFSIKSGCFSCLFFSTVRSGSRSSISETKIAG
jgi:hypothetical protein